MGGRNAQAFPYYNLLYWNIDWGNLSDASEQVNVFHKRSVTISSNFSGRVEFPNFFGLYRGV